MTDPNDLQAFLSEAWQHLENGVADGTSPARYPTFATVSNDGTPEARTVALRGADPAQGTVEVHTDTETDKITSLQHNPRAALHIWLPAFDFQIRLTADVDILSGPEVEPQWARVPAGSRVSYGTEPIPGTPINHVYAYEKPSLRSRFAVLRCNLAQIDLVHLPTRHRRGVFTRQDNWRGTWVAP